MLVLGSVPSRKLTANAPEKWMVWNMIPFLFWFWPTFSSANLLLVPGSDLFCFLQKNLPGLFRKAPKSFANFHVFLMSLGVWGGVHRVEESMNFNCLDVGIIFSFAFALPMLWLKAYTKKKSCTLKILNPLMETPDPPNDTLWGLNTGNLTPKTTSLTDS